MSIITSIGTILDDTERHRCNIYIDQCKYGNNCYTCGVPSRFNWYVRVCPPNTTNIAKVHWVHNILCVGCIAELYYCRDVRLEHIFEMYKAIRCIHSDVAKYMLKFIFIPSII